MQQQWNYLYTQLIRKTRSSLWGNWALNAQVQPGAVGIIDPTTGEFRLVKESVPGVELVEMQENRQWKMISEGSRRTEVKAEGGVAIIDPSTGAVVSPSGKIDWFFDKKGSLTSEFAVANSTHIRDLTVLKDQFDWLAAQAASVNMGTNSGISQGFGVVTNVVYARSGLNVGSNEDKCAYTLTGSVTGLNALLGNSKANDVKTEASYVGKSSTKSVDEHTWPAKDAKDTATLVPIAFGFTSFSGTTMMPNWAQHIGGLSIIVDSKFSKGTTYTTEVTLSYDAAQGRRSQSVMVVGGGSHIFNDIPLDAANLDLTFRFIGILNDNVETKHWASPLAQWATGMRHIDISGTWPGATKVEVLEELGR